ncbi:MAG: NAD(P)H-dependent oxidoreductase subunit E, partial [bacterium]
MTQTIKTNKDLEALRTKLKGQRESRKYVITVCGGTGCHGYGCEKVIEAFRQEIASQKLDKDVELRVSGCHGFCERGPLALLAPSGVFYQRIDVADVPEIIKKTLLGKEVIDKLLYVRDDGTKAVHEKDVPFYAKQNRLIFANNQRINADSIEDYIAVGGYAALAKAFAMKPEAIIEEMKKSG